METSTKTIAVAVAACVALTVSSAQAESSVYGPFPVTVKNYAGNQTDSTSYGGQVARQVLHNGLKKLASKGDGGANQAEVEAQMQAYFSGKSAGRKILSPVTKGDFVIKQNAVDDLSKDKNLKSKAYKGAITGWPGNMTGAEVLDFMISKAAATKGGFDPLTGLNYPQLISKFAMGAVFYNQAVDNYLDEKLQADRNPNDKAYKEGKPYTGKEHVWDEAFGYFGAPVHALQLDAKQAYGIAKQKDLAVADFNKDGEIDLKSEMTFAHAYYAADADKSGSNYMHTIVQAFIDGRQLISSANGEKLSDAERNELMGYANVIKTNWEKVIAEAAFKYAGSVYKDLGKLQSVIESGGDAKAIFADYAKHWGELKGFLLALEAGGKNLGETGVKINRLVGYGPVLLGGGQVIGLSADGEYQTGGEQGLGSYTVNMLKLQQLLADSYGLSARKNDATADLNDVIESLGESLSAEND